MFQEYFEQGYSIIPIKQGEKRPTREGWSRYCRELPSEKEIESWERLRDTGINIGVCLGPASGIVALDIDTDDAEILKHLPLSPVRKTGRDGRETRFFRFRDEIKNQKLHPVEILSTGSQTVLPPSIHPGTRKPYRWLTPDTLLNFDKEDLPELDLSFIPKLPLKERGQEGGRLNKLTSIISAKLFDGKADDEIEEEVYRYDADNHTPPLYWDKKDRFKGAQTEDQARRNAKKHIDSVKRSLGSELKPAPVIDLDSNETEEWREKPYPKARGLMGEFQDYCEIASEGAQEALSLGGAIAMMGTVCSNRFKAKGIWANVYVLNVAQSGWGKNTPQNLLSHIFTGTTLQGAQNYSSGTSIIQGLGEQPERLDIIDECSHILNAMSKGDHFQSNMVEYLSLLFSASSSMFGGVSSMSNGKKFGACYNPCVNLLMSTTPQGFIESVNREMASKGLLARFLTFHQSKLGKRKPMASEAVREAQRAALKKAILTLVSNYPKRTLRQTSDLLQDPKMGLPANPIDLPFSDDADTLIEHFSTKCFDIKAAVEDEFESAFAARFVELAVKLSIFDAVSMSRKTIEADSVEWAISVVETQWNNAQALYEDTDSSNYRESNFRKIESFIRNKGIVKKSELLRKFRKIKKYDMDELLETMCDAALIEKRYAAADGRGRKPIVFVSLFANSFPGKNSVRQNEIVK